MARASRPKLATPYQIPFPVELQPAPLFSSGGTVFVTAEMLKAPRAKAVVDLNSFADAFWCLSVTGALGGDMVEPWTSMIADKSEPEVSGNSIVWQLEQCNTDERAAVMLTHLLFGWHHRHAIKRITMELRPEPRPRIPLAHDANLENPYPPSWPSIRFPVHREDFVSDHQTLMIQFKKAPEDEEIENIRSELQSWAIAPTVGAYANAPSPPQKSTFDPSEEIEIIDEELTWTLLKTRFHPGALDGLVNVCVAIDHDKAAIRELRLG